MSEEEKKATELLKNIEKNKQKCLMLECPVVKNNVKRQLKIIELKKELDNQIRAREIQEKFIEEKFIYKSDIEEEIEELKNMKIGGEVFETARNFAIKILKDLLIRSKYYE